MKKIIFVLFLFSFNISVFSQILLTPNKDEKKEEGSKSIWVFRKNELNKNEKKDFWKDINDEKKVFMSFSKDTTSTLYTEFLSDQLGLWRFSFAGAISTASNDTIQDIETFFETGGNVILKVSYPLYLLYSNKYPRSNLFGVYFSTTIGGTLPKLGSYTSNLTGNIDAGLEIQASVATNNENFGFYTILKTGFVTGTKDFLEVWAADGKKIFGYGKGIVGLVLKKTIRISLNFPMHIVGKTDPIDKIPTSIMVGLEF